MALLFSTNTPQALLNDSTYGVYQGRFIESMITHCQDLFSNASATAKALNSDYVKAA
jgi:hypothetical protein